jgi:hypothetical protein
LEEAEELVEAGNKDYIPDFAEVEWKSASPEMQQRTMDYGTLEAVKLLLGGTAIEIPSNTRLNRLYRWLDKQGYRLRRHKTKNSLVIWVEKKPETTSEEPITAE